MKCTIYKGKKKPDHYVYLAEGDDLERIPSQLLQLVGALEFVMNIDVNESTRLASAKPKDVLSSITQNGFYLQLPPPLV